MQNFQPLRVLPKIKVTIQGETLVAYTHVRSISPKPSMGF